MLCATFLFRMAFYLHPLPQASASCIPPNAPVGMVVTIEKIWTIKNCGKISRTCLARLKPTAIGETNSARALLVTSSEPPCPDQFEPNDAPVSSIFNEVPGRATL